MSKIFAGWLYADLEEYDKLRELGVYGPMVFMYSNSEIAKKLGKNGHIYYCLCNEETLKKLQDRYTPLWQSRYPHINHKDTNQIYPRWSEIKQDELDFEFVRSTKYDG